MPTSKARIAANRANSLRSTGPKTAEGKERSRRNGLKHGLTGEGIVLKDEDVDEVASRSEELMGDLAPRSAMGRILVRQLATLSVRMERGERQESAALASRVRHAAEEFDAARVDRAVGLLGGIADDPRGCVRKLLRSPEGVDELAAAWGDLRDDLARGGRASWTSAHLERAAHLSGLRTEAARGSRLGALSRAVWGDFEGIGEAEGGGLDEEPRQAWARDRLMEQVEAEIAGLEEYRDSLDLESIELDRAEAADVALFDPSKPAALARRYESEARRGFYKALDQLREAEAEAADRPAAVVEPIPGPADPPLGSSWRDAPAVELDPSMFSRPIPAAALRPIPAVEKPAGTAPGPHLQRPALAASGTPGGSSDSGVSA